MKCLTEAVQRL